MVHTYVFMYASDRPTQFPSKKTYLPRTKNFDNGRILLISHPFVEKYFLVYAIYSSKISIQNFCTRTSISFQIIGRILEESFSRFLVLGRYVIVLVGRNEA